MTLKELLNSGDRFAATSGIVITRVEPGLCEAEMTVAENHLNAAGVCQGGALFTLADVSMAGVANATGQVTLGINGQIEYIHSAHLGDHLTAHCIAVADGKLPLATVDVRNQDGTLIAHFTAQGYRKRDPLPFDGLM